MIDSKPSYQELEQRIAELEAEIALQDNDLKVYRLLFKHLNYEIHIWQLVRNADGSIRTWRLVDANPKALSLWNKTLPEVIGKTTDEIFPGADATEVFMPVIEKTFETGKPFSWEQAFDGTGQILSMITIPFDDYFISAGVDVTGLRKTELELKETVLQLEESIHAGNVGIWDWDLITNEVKFSKEYKQQLGYQEDEIADDFSEWERRVHPDDLNPTLAAVQKSIETLSQNHESVFRMKHKDGTYRWILSHASVIADDSGKPVRMLGSHIDINERKQLEMSMNQMQKNESLGTLASGIAHDFNNLLAPIIGYTEMSIQAIDDDAPAHKYLSKVQTTAMRAKALIQKILMISRPSSTTLEAVDISELAKEVIAVIKASAPKNVFIQTELDEDIALIDANTTEIYQVLLNLCTNALQAMKESGGRLFVKASAYISASRILLGEGKPPGVLLEITDEGCGMKTETLEHIFDPFFTTKKQTGERGTGLGLSIVASVVKKYDGLIDVDSQAGQGTTFKIYFPEGQLQKLNDHEASRPMNDPGEAHILFIDDEEMNCELGAEILRELGYKVTEYTDPIEALQEIEVNHAHYDLVITDYSMPMLSGPELIQQVRGIAPQLPVMLVTGHSNLATPDSAKEYDCDHILGKPYTIKVLGESVADLLEGH